MLLLSDTSNNYIGSLATFLLLLFQNDFIKGMRFSVSHFDYLIYDTSVVHEQHLHFSHRVASATHHDVNPVKIDFISHGRNFQLSLRYDDSIFTSDLIIEGPKHQHLDGEVLNTYHGTLIGVDGSVVYGSIIDGIFRGVIEDPFNGNFYLEESTLFFENSFNSSIFTFPMNGHSVMYHRNAVKMPRSSGLCANINQNFSTIQTLKAMQGKTTVLNDDPLHKLQRLKRQTKSNGKSIFNRRTVKKTDNKLKKTCLLYIQTDWVLYNLLKTKEVILARIAEHVKAVNRIYEKAQFVAKNGQKFTEISFKVSRVKINDSTTVQDRSNPFRYPYIGVEKFLNLLSNENHDDYCLTYIFTNRDFDDGVLGLAWVGAYRGSSGGICEKFTLYPDGPAKSLNTGILTFTNYGSSVPAVVTHITFAHELGHSLGSPHDTKDECVPGDAGSYLGNYIMYPRATSGSKRNNDKFSPCSITSIGNVLQAKKHLCFVASDAPVCGNQLLDDGEECDCGFRDGCTDLKDSDCCYPGDFKNVTMRCKLKSTAKCSISQGPCCTTSCTFADSSQRCLERTECHDAQFCSGNSSICAAPNHKAYEKKECNSNTQVCLEGECAGSVCLLYSELEPCICAVSSVAEDRSKLCHTCCQFKGKPKTCASSGDARLSQYFKKKVIFRKPGSACDNFKGYCDIFSYCRPVNADGPLSRLTTALFSPKFFLDLLQWVAKFWWLVFPILVVFITSLVALFRACNVHSVPRQSTKVKPLPGAEAILHALHKVYPMPYKEPIHPESEHKIRRRSWLRRLFDRHAYDSASDDHKLSSIELEKIRSNIVPTEESSRSLRRKTSSLDENYSFYSFHSKKYAGDDVRSMMSTKRSEYSQTKKMQPQTTRRRLFDEDGNVYYVDEETVKKSISPAQQSKTDNKAKQSSSNPSTYQQSKPEHVAEQSSSNPSTHHIKSMLKEKLQPKMLKEKLQSNMLKEKLRSKFRDATRSAPGLPKPKEEKPLKSTSQVIPNRKWSRNSVDYNYDLDQTYIYDDDKGAPTLYRYGTPPSSSDSDSPKV